MVTIPLGNSDWRRALAKEPNIYVQNRYYEQNPTNLSEGSALLARPGLQRMLEIGDGPIRATYSAPGTFDEALFVVSGSQLFKVDPDETFFEIGNGVLSSLTSYPSFAATNEFEAAPALLYFCEGGTLYCWTDNGFAFNTLQGSGTPGPVLDGNGFEIGGIYYQWTAGDVNAGTQDGTVGAPYLLMLGNGTTDAYDSAFHAVNLSGDPATYSEFITERHPTVTATEHPNGYVKFRARAAGPGGNSITVSSTTPALAWTGAHLVMGGEPSLDIILVPDDDGIVSVGYIASYVICVVTQGYGKNGRFYWIKPGETIIDPLDYATAERAPDPLHSVRVVGDQFWLLGTNSTEVWYPSGDPDQPMRRVQGRLFDRGVWQGTDVQIKDSVFVVDNDGIVWDIAGQPKRVSDHSVEERIRKAIIAEKQGT